MGDDVVPTPTLIREVLCANGFSGEDARLNTLCDLPENSIGPIPSPLHPCVMMTFQTAGGVAVVRSLGA